VIGWRQPEGERKRATKPTDRRLSSLYLSLARGTGRPGSVGRPIVLAPAACLTKSPPALIFFRTRGRRLSLSRSCQRGKHMVERRVRARVSCPSYRGISRTRLRSSPQQQAAASHATTPLATAASRPPTPHHPQVLGDKLGRREEEKGNPTPHFLRFVPEIKLCSPQLGGRLRSAPPPARVLSSPPTFSRARDLPDLARGLLLANL
jgi:hypothetical protein